MSPLHHSRSDKSEVPREESPGGVVANVSDLLRSAAYTSVQRPVESVVQIVRHTTPFEPETPVIVKAPVHDNNWTTGGAMVGSVAEFFVLAKSVGGLRSALGRATSVPILEAGVSGALFEVFQPAAEKDFGMNKLKSAALGFGTFATMDGAALGLGKIPLLARSEGLFKTVTINGAAGAGGGLTHSVLGAGLDGRTPTYSEVKGNVVSYAAFGAMFGALDHGATRGTQAIKAKVQDRIANGEPIFSLGPIELHQKGYHTKAKEMAQVDNLTGLKNKAGGDDVLRSEIARADRQQEPLSMTYMDLDGFKGVNDKFGHHQGDQVLKEVAAQIKKYFSRGTDKPVREGGDEFMVVLPNTNLAHAENLASGFEKTMRIAVGKEAPTPAQLHQNFPGQLAKIKDIPRSTPTGEGQPMSDLAAELVSARMSLTGESLKPEIIKAEVKRLQERTGLPENQVFDGRTVQVYNDADIAKFAQQASFRFLPQIGQMLKVKGYATEAQISEAIAIQAKQPADKKQLLGEILVEKKISTQAQVDDVFRDQMIAKEALSRILESMPGLKYLQSGMKAFRLPEKFHSAVDPTALRVDIPHVERPHLNVNGVRPLGVFESPVGGELVVGVSTGAVQWKQGEAMEALKYRGDKLMFEKKDLRKALGLRQDRVVQPQLVHGDN